MQYDGSVLLIASGTSKETAWGGSNVSNIDTGAFEDLSAAEPGTPDQRATWVDLYRRLIEMMERQLEETEAFAKSAPEPMRQYLARENIAILTEEIEAFKDRLAHWSGPGASET